MEKKKLSLNFFRKYIANIIIACVLLTLVSITYIGGVLNVFSGAKPKVYYNGNKNNPNVTMMINVYWGNEYLEGILNVLKENDVKTTFFVGGTWVNSFPELLLKIYEDGHEIANHGYYHKDHDKISYERNQEEIYVTHKLVKSTINVDMNLFAPPSGAFNDTTLEVAENLGYKTIMWTKDTIDWRDKNTELIYQRAVKNPKNGDLILMHPTKNTLEALPRIISFYKENGYNLTTVSENIKE